MDRLELKKTCIIKSFVKLKNKQKCIITKSQNKQSPNKIKTKHVYYKLCTLKIRVRYKINLTNVFIL